MEPPPTMGPKSGHQNRDVHKFPMKSDTNKVESLHMH